MVFETLSRSISGHCEMFIKNELFPNSQEYAVTIRVQFQIRKGYSWCKYEVWYVK